MNNFSILCFLLIIVHVCCNFSQYIPQTDINSKETPNKNLPPISLSSSTFMEFISNSNIFVDKSRLIEKILLDPHKIIVISRPRYWGKTINLNMLKTFLELTVDQNGNAKVSRRALPNYCLFVKGEIRKQNGQKEKLQNPFLISKKKQIIKNHLCRHPVIYVDFKDISHTNYQDMMNEVKIRISNAFKSHEYMVDIFYKFISNGTGNETEKQHVQKSLNFFNKILSIDPSITESDSKSSLKFLSEILYNHFKVLVFILIDEYDAPIISIYSDLEFNKYNKGYFLNFHTNLLIETFIDNNFTRGILTGRFPLAQDDIDIGLDEVVDYTVTKTNGHLMEYYGFSMQEIINISTISNTSLHYILYRANTTLGNNYQYPHHEIFIYNPGIIAKILSKSESLNWLDVNQLKNFVSFFTSSGVRNFVTYLYAFKLSECNGYPLELDFLNYTRFTRNDFDLLHKAFKCQFDYAQFSEKLSNMDLDQFTHKSMMFLYSYGYFSIIASDNKTINIAYRCENYETCEQFIDVIYKGHMINARKMLFTIF